MHSLELPDLFFVILLMLRRLEIDDPPFRICISETTLVFTQQSIQWFYKRQVGIMSNIREQFVVQWLTEWSCDKIGNLLVTWPMKENFISLFVASSPSSTSIWYLENFAVLMNRIRASSTEIRLRISVPNENFLWSASAHCLLWNLWQCVHCVQDPKTNMKISNGWGCRCGCDLKTNDNRFLLNLIQSMFMLPMLLLNVKKL